MPFTLGSGEMPFILGFRMYPFLATKRPDVYLFLADALFFVMGGNDDDDTFDSYGTHYEDIIRCVHHIYDGSTIIMECW